MATPEQIAKLSEYDFIVAIDVSGSTSETDTKTGASRLSYMAETTIAFSRELAAIDSDGIGLVTFGASVKSYDGVNADKIKEVFATTGSRGTTPLAEALIAALALAGKSDKKDFIMVLTDGIPDNKTEVERVIREAANKMTTDDELTILFVQVGRDAAATAFLAKLDDELTGCKFDIVDAMTIEQAEQFDSIADLVLKAIND